MSLAAFAKTNSITIPCRGPIEAPAGGLRASSDGDAWEFSLVPGDHTELYDQHWFFNGIAPGTPNITPAWGQLLGGQDGSNALSWLSPTQGGSYSIKVQAKRRCTQTGGGGGGDAFDPNFEISWGVEVAAKKTWDVGSAIAVTSLIPAANAKAAPGDAVACSVTAADNDHWKKGTAPDAEQGVAADELTYQWSASGGFFSGSGASVNWTPPNATGTYTLTCIVDDKPTELSPIDDGTRDDTPLTVSVEVEVPPRTWSAGFGIGKLLDDQGRLLDKDYQPITTSQQVPAENGRLIAPQDRTKPLPAGATAWPVVEVRPGEKLGCALEGATDFDHWKRPGLSGTDNAIGQPATNSGQYAPPYYGRTFGDEGDELTYTWSKSGGGNASSGAWEGTTDATVSGASAVWIAPAADPNSPNDNQYTLTCTVDDKPTAVAAPDAPLGTTARDDAALTRTVTVQVVDATSWMALSLYKDQDGHADPASPVMGKAGGTVWIATDVQIGGKTKIVSPLAPHLRIEELDGQNLHGDDAVHGHDNHAYLPVPLSGWVEWNFQTNQWGTTPLSLPDHNDDETPKRYRCYVKWITFSQDGVPAYTCADPDGDGPLHEGKLWGHNAPHNIQLEYSVPHTDQNNHTTYEVKHEMEFQPLSEAEPPRKKGPNPAAANVGNLVITEAKASDGSEDYVRFIPYSTEATLNSPSISTSFADGDYRPGDRYTYMATFVETGGSIEPIVVSGNVPDGSPSNFAIPFPAAPRGVYGFEVRLNKIRGGIIKDYQMLRSEALAFGSTEIYESTDGYYQFRYTIVPRRSNVSTATNVKVDEINPKLDISITSGDLIAPEYTSLNSLHAFSLRDPFNEINGEPTPGSARVVAVGLDSQRNSYRNHENHRLLPLNAAKPTYVIWSLVGPHIGKIDHLGNRIEYGWKMGDPGNAKNGNGFSTQLPGSNSQVLITSSAPGIESRNPQGIWEWLVAKGANIAIPKRNYRLVNTQAHATNTGIEISYGAGSWGYYYSEEPNGPIQGRGGKGAGLMSDNTDPILRDTITGGGVGEVDWWIGNGARLTGVYSWNSMGCNTAAQTTSTPVSFTDYAPTRGTKNAVGYKPLTYSENATGIRSRAQLWYNCYYRVGLATNIIGLPGNINSTGTNSLTVATQEYLRISALWDAMDGTKTFSWGWEKWRIANPGMPLIDAN